MIPSTAIGLLLLVGILGPGYVWVTYSEQRRPRQERSGVLEAADVLIVGSLAAGLATMILFGAAELWGWLPTLPDLLPDPSSFASSFPYRITAWFAAVFVLATGGVRSLAWLRYRGIKPQIHPESTVWYETFKAAATERTVLVKAELVDGRLIEGVFWSHLIDGDVAEKDLALRAPIRVVSSPRADGSRMHMDHRAHRVVIPGSQIRTVWVYYTWEPDPVRSVILP